MTIFSRDRPLEESVRSKKFAGKIAVVTGGSTGMGLATAKRFVQEGMDHVFITGRRKDTLDTAVELLILEITTVRLNVEENQLANVFGEFLRLRREPEERIKWVFSLRKVSLR
jgi:NAD(P)-dependent dehydrogenase (short-subunit alcohol dehydrogenase family)